MKNETLLDRCYAVYTKCYADSECFTKKEFEEEIFGNRTEMEILFRKAEEPELFREWHNAMVVENQEELLKTIEDATSDYFDVISNEQETLLPAHQSMSCLLNEATEYVSEIEFWSDLGEDVVEIVRHDGTLAGFLAGLKQLAKDFDVDDHAELYVGLRGSNGVPNASMREFLDDAEGIKNTLTKAAEALEAYINENEKQSFSGEIENFSKDGVELPQEDIVTNLDVQLTARPDGTFGILIREPESGEQLSLEATKETLLETLSGRVVEEMQSWCSLMEDKLEENEYEER